MPEKLLTLDELSSYLGISEEKIITLVDRKIVSAYKIGGEFLRFRKDQIDAIRAEIYSRIQDSDRVSVKQTRHREEAGKGEDSFRDKMSDFLYFYDFYLVSAFLIAILLVIIFRG